MSCFLSYAWGDSFEGIEVRSVVSSRELRDKLANEVKLGKMKNLKKTKLRFRDSDLLSFHRDSGAIPSWRNKRGVAREVDMTGDQMGYAWGWSRVRVPFWAIKRSVVLELSLNSFLTSYYPLCSICSPCLSKTPAFIAMLVAIPFLVLASLHQIGGCCCEGLPISTRLRGLTMLQLVPSGIRRL